MGFIGIQRGEDTILATGRTGFASGGGRDWGLPTSPAGVKRYCGGEVILMVSDG